MDSRLPPQGPPPPYSFVSRVYKRNLRPVVLAISSISFFWTLFASIGFFRNATLTDLRNVPKLRIAYIILGALYMLAAAIELLGVTAAGTQRLPLIRSYAYATILSVLVVAGSGLLEVITHFTLEDDIIHICTSLSKDAILYFSFFGPVTRDILDSSSVREVCANYWDRDSWRDILLFIITTLLAVFFSTWAFAYLRQTLDPSSPANALRAPSYANRTAEYPSHYNPPYNTGFSQPYYGQQYGYGYGYGYNSNTFAPPDEAKPEYTLPEGKVGYDEDTKDPFADQHRPSGSRA